MKLFRSKVILATGVCVAGMLGACQQENDGVLAPQSEVAKSDQNARIALAAGTLIKDGNIDLEYYNGSALLKKESSANAYYQFDYAPQLITATRYQVGTPPTQSKYTLDASGRCVQSVTDKTYIYTYNADGQLQGCYNKDAPKEQIIFSFHVDANGWKKSLSMVSFYDKQGAKTKEITFGYGAAAAFIPEKNPLTPDVLPTGVSKYLPIFGYFNTNLVKSTTVNTYLPNGQLGSSTAYFYSYTLGYSDKPTNITVKKANGTLVSSTDRKYSIPKYNF